ncbi:unnamed protein product [Cuscuta epithymum]|uniref:Thioredoxin domain-containing protein n=1 Tax=Cuscuta epithymum TaxID=186058 RepID=A0AAV0EB43_9ASTE|nr:unnamed protein product [Cuscuta epithymum]
MIENIKKGTESNKLMLHVIFLKVDVDELKDAAELYSVEAMPTLVFLVGGVEVHRIVGANKDELKNALDKHAVQASP